MRKRHLTGAIAVILAVIAVIFAGCTNQGYEIETFYLNMTRATSLTYGYSLDSSLHGSTEGEYRVQGDKDCTKNADGTVYTEQKDGYVYTYRKIEGNWERSTSNFEQGQTSILTGVLTELKEFFRKENYTYDSEIGKYVLNEGVKLSVFNGKSVKKMTMEVKSGVAWMTGSFEDEENVGAFSIVIKDIGTTLVELPSI